MVDEELNCTVEQLWSIICQPDAKFQQTIHSLSGNREIQYGSWSQHSKTVLQLSYKTVFEYCRSTDAQGWRACTGGVLSREETYINPLKKNSLGPKEAFCLDQQKCVQRNSSGFVLERKVFTPKVVSCLCFHLRICMSCLSSLVSYAPLLQICF